MVMSKRKRMREYTHGVNRERILGTNHECPSSAPQAWSAFDATTNAGQQRFVARGVAYFMLATVVLLLIGNLVDPGTWPVWINIVIWSFAGSYFIWFPFAAPFAMFAFDVLVHRAHVERLRNDILTSSTQEREGQWQMRVQDVSARYMALYDRSKEVSRTFSWIMLLQLATLMLSVFVNVWHVVDGELMHAFCFPA